MSPVAIMLIWNRVHSGGTLTKGHKQAAFHVRFIEIPVLECGVVSQQYNGKQHTNPNIGIQIHMP